MLHASVNHSGTEFWSPTGLEGRKNSLVTGRNPINAPLTECLDWILIFGRRHLERVLGVYVDHYQRGRPHRGLGLATPIRPQGRAGPACHVGAVRRRDLLGGLIHEYSRSAA